MILMTRPALAETNAMKLGNQPGPKALSEQHCGLDSKPLGNPQKPARLEPQPQACACGSVVMNITSGTKRSADET